MKEFFACLVFVLISFERRVFSGWVKIPKIFIFFLILNRVYIISFWLNQCNSFFLLSFFFWIVIEYKLPRCCLLKVDVFGIYKSIWVVDHLIISLLKKIFFSSKKKVVTNEFTFILNKHSWLKKYFLATIYTFMKVFVIDFYFIIFLLFFILFLFYICVIIFKIEKTFKKDIEGRKNKQR